MRAIRADNGAQLRLLDLQTVDTKLAQLGHRRQTLPEHGVIAKLQTRRSAPMAELGECRVDGLQIQQAQLRTFVCPDRSHPPRKDRAFLRPRAPP